MADLKRAKGEADQVGDALKKAADFSEPRSNAKLNYTRHLASSGNLEQAISYLEEQLAQAKDYIPGWIMLAELTARQKKYDPALTYLDKVFGRDPSNPAALGMKARIYTARGDTSRATAIYEQLDQTYANSPLFKFNVAKAHLREGAELKAKVALEQTLALYPEFPEAILILAQLNMRSGETTAAILSLERLLKNRPNLIQVQFVLAQAYEMEGRLDDAAAIFRAQIEAAPNGAGSHYMLGKILRRQGKANGARVHLEKANSLAPKNQAILNDLVDLDLAEKKFELASGRISDADESKPDVWFLRGKIFAAQENWDEAEKALQKALEIQPDSDAIYDLLISIYLKSEQVPEAVQRLQDLLAEKPDSLRHRMMLALLYERVDDRGEIGRAIP